jgi:hypothetical protein
MLRGRWCHITILNIHALTEDKIDDVKGSFYEELKVVFDNFPKYHMQIDLIEDEIKKRLSSGNACYHSVQNLVSQSVVKKPKN